MYGLIKEKLRARKRPIEVVISGSGWFGSGLARELFRIGGINPAVLVDRFPEKCVSVYLEMGIKKSDIALVTSSRELRKAQEDRKYIVFSDINLIGDLKDIDVIFEATGDIEAGVKTAIISIDKRIPFVSANFEMDAVVGPVLASQAKEKGGLYVNADGDQPSVLSRMIDEITIWGFEPKIAGNCKGFIDLHQDPTGVKLFVPSYHNNTQMVCSMADGTKQSIEMAVLGNSYGYYPFKRGMHGPTTVKRDIIKTFDDLVDLRALKGTYVDFVLGINGVDQGAGVFIIAYREGARIKEDMNYLKKGDGPFYLFFRDHHLCYFEAVSSIAEAVFFGISSFCPKGRYVDVISIAKRDLVVGQPVHWAALPGGGMARMARRSARLAHPSSRQTIRDRGSCAPPPCRRRRQWWRHPPANRRGHPGSASAKPPPHRLDPCCRSGSRP